MGSCTAPRDMLGRQSAGGGRSAGDYEQIVVIFARYPNHFPDLANWQVELDAAGSPVHLHSGAPILTGSSYVSETAVQLLLLALA